MKFIIHCKIKDLRKEHDLTQEELAQKIGISRQALIALEQGKSLPSLDLAFEFSNLFEKSIEELFTNIENQLENKSANNINFLPLKIRAEGKEKTMPRDLMPWRNFGLGRFLDEDWGDDDLMPSVSVKKSLIPAVNVYETDKNVVLEAHLPGMKPEDVNIEVAEDYITLSGERKEEKVDKNKNYYRKEVSYGSFSRVVPLPVKVKSETAEAETKDGVLVITLPKAEFKKTKKIIIKPKK